jgi:predicted CXXCH cytochrome family protein
MKRRSVAMWCGYAVIAALIAGLFASSVPAQTRPSAPEDKTPPADKATAPNESVAICLGCHEDKALSLTLKDGSTMSLYVDAREFARSVHGTQLVCTDCHANAQNHPSGATFPSRRAYTIAAYETCKKCHFDAYTRTLESVHYELLKAGLETAPVCTDCHGSHAIQNPHEKREMVSRSCATCHDDIYKKYAASVHGKALVEGGNKDVPACADCHTHHQIRPPGTTQFRLNSPELCIRCHGDARLMARYGISARVAQTYLADFHGVTAALGRGSPATQQKVVVTCVDCHGVHDIASPRVKGEAAMKASVAASCQKCHPGASPSFPAAWLSHYEPSIRHAPLVFFIDLFYKIFIPFVVIGLALHVLLHLYRVSLGR